MDDPVLSTEETEERKESCSNQCRTFDPDRYVALGHYIEGDYDKVDTISFNELLETHCKQTVWGFKYGEETMKRAQENQRLARVKNSQEKRKIDDVSCSPTRIEDLEETVEETNQPCCSNVITESDHKTPHSHKRQRMLRRSRRIRTIDSVSEICSRKTPLPLLHWADSQEVWLFMVYKEEASLHLRNARLFEDFTNFLPRMRAILLDWIMEVCEVYHLRRVTYYLSVDYFDRFLSIRPDVPKNQLQLVGVTCLFLASKLEEIYPPRLSEFSYVCDGACSPNDILACELLILNSLGWDLNLMTPSDWLNLYMQIYFNVDSVTKQKMHSEINRNFIFPQYSAYQFTRASQLIDLCSLDPGFLQYSYSTIAAAAMYYMYGKKAALSVSGLSWDQLKSCSEYMSVFYQVVRHPHDPKLQSCSHTDPGNEETINDPLKISVIGLLSGENHSLQTHVVNMEYFEKATVARLEQMGLRVKKHFVKTCNDENKSIEDENQTEKNVEKDGDYFYDIETIYDEIIDSEDELKDLDILKQENNSTILEKNSAITLDQMLSDIVKCNTQLVQLTDSDEDNESR